MVAQSRPVFLVGVNDHFELVSANEIHPSDLAAAASPEYRHLPWTGPRLVGATPPTDSDTRIAIAMDAVNGGPDLHRLPKYYVSFAKVASGLVASGKALDHFADADAAQVEKIRQELTRRKVAADAVIVLPLKARRGVGAVVMTRENAAPLFTVAVDGYQ